MRSYFDTAIEYWDWLIDNGMCINEFVEDMIFDKELTDSEVCAYVVRLRHEENIC